MIILGFPGCGKTVATQMFQVVDSDSSTFQGERRFERYVDHVISQHEQGKVVLGATHARVQELLDQSGVPYLTVGPRIDQKERWIKRLRLRNTGLNDDKFVTLISDNWDEWVSALAKRSAYITLDAYDPSAFVDVLQGMGVAPRVTPVDFATLHNPNNIEAGNTGISVEDIAKVIHEANRAYCQTQGDFSQRPWEETQRELRASVITGVLQHLHDPHITPRTSHENWMKAKANEGWKYGPVKDVNAKEHPCFVDYTDLPNGQKLKDHLFKSIVDVLGHLDAKQL